VRRDRHGRQHHQQAAGDRLQDHSRQREQHVGDDDGGSRARNERDIAAQMRHQHEEGDAASRAENHHRAEHVQILDQKIQRHRFRTDRCPPR